MKRLCVLPCLVFAGCSAPQSSSVAPAPQTVSVVTTPAPPPVVSAPVSSSPATTSGSTVLGANVEPTPDPNAIAPAITDPPKNDFLVPDVTAVGGVKTYSEEMMRRVDAANSSDELIKIRGDIANNALFFDKASRDAGRAGITNEFILNQRISTLCDSLSDYARNKSGLIDGSLTENLYAQVKRGQLIEISHNAFMVDTFFAAHRK
ncbi:hypothetical protein IAD21_02454 [Abditibacteriota bacterium]|nr:hypothetical protein IAD21_02454 [Abditibacteriota bacterium]